MIKKEISGGVVHSLPDDLRVVLSTDEVVRVVG